MDWYETHIEKPIIDLVRLLRDNGFNTQCSCGHEKYVECQYIPGGDIQRLDNLLFDNGYKNYEITISVSRQDGHLNSWLSVKEM